MRARATFAGVGLVAMVTFVMFTFIQTLAAQQPTTGIQLDPSVQAAVDEVVAHAREQGLPTEPLVDKAFEGTAKHAEPARIVSAVRMLVSGLSAARRQLGATAGVPDLVAGADVLRAGVDPEVLAKLRHARPNQTLLVPLVVLADLVARGVPPNAAANAVLVLADRGASNAEFTTMQQDVQRDIQAGAAPEDAAAVRSGDKGNAASTAPGASGAPGQAHDNGKAPTGKPAGGKPPTAGPKQPPGQAGGQPHGPPTKPPKATPPKGKPPKGDQPHSS